MNNKDKTLEKNVTQTVLSDRSVTKTIILLAVCLSQVSYLYSISDDKIADLEQRVQLLESHKANVIAHYNITQVYNAVTRDEYKNINTKRAELMKKQRDLRSQIKDTKYNIDNNDLLTASDLKKMQDFIASTEDTINMYESDFRNEVSKIRQSISSKFYRAVSFAIQELKEYDAILPVGTVDSDDSTADKLYYIGTNSKYNRFISHRDITDSFINTVQSYYDNIQEY